MSTKSNGRPDMSHRTGMGSVANLTLAQVEDGALLAFDMASDQVDRSLDLIAREDSDETEITAAAIEFAAYRRSVHDSVLKLFSRRAFATSDLRLMAVLLHVIDALERIDDHCVEIAELMHGTEEEAALAPVSRVALLEMGELVRAQLSLAREMLRTRNTELAERFLEGRAEVRRRGEGLLKQTIVEGNSANSGGPAVIGLAHSFESISESASEIAEQMVFLLAGLFREVSENSSSSAAVEAFMA